MTKASVNITDANEKGADLFLNKSAPFRQNV
jgi:hypothetical protein